MSSPSGPYRTPLCTFSFKTFYSGAASRSACDAHSRVNASRSSVPSWDGRGSAPERQWRMRRSEATTSRNRHA